MGVGNDPRRKPKVRLTGMSKLGWVAFPETEFGSPPRRGALGLDLVTAGINALVVSAVGLALLWLGKERFEAQDRRMDQIEERLERRLDTLQSSVDSMRSDLTQVALAVGARRRATNT
jgi:hypothetical protein